MFRSLRKSLSICTMLTLACAGAQAQDRFVAAQIPTAAGLTACGNGVVDLGEGCDDGNRADGDCCSSSCRLPVGIVSGPVVNPANNHRYYLLQNASWPASEAQAVCLGSHLVTINDAAEQNWVWSEFSRYGGVDRNIWIGLTDEALEGIFVWSSGDPLQYTNWIAGEPNNSGDEDYVHLRWIADGGWNDIAGAETNVDGIPVHGVVELTDCGNGAVDPGEECDDGNDDPVDGCTNACTICGNGTRTQPEQCDDHNLTNGDGCDANCTVTACGNGVPTVGEQCDDGNADSCDGCSPACQTEPRGYQCGDGVVSAACGEECDDGNADSNDACRTDCRLNVCGDGFRNPATEQCDDGNANSCDGCSPLCRVEAAGYRCGDGVVVSACGEECDDGNTSNNDLCRTDCRRNVCGDGFVDPDAEECDDGNASACDGCSPLCRVERAGYRCGDGVVVSACGEECDDGNTSNNDPCRTDCRRNVCGDGFVDPQAEQCDDGNRNPFDGCTNDCTVCGDGTVTSPEECDGSNPPSDAGCDAQCRRPHVVGTGTPQSCTEAAFTAALAERSVRFNCGPHPVTITLTGAAGMPAEKVITAATTIDGGGLVTLRGGGAARIFRVDAGAVLDVRNLTIAGGRADDGGGILNSGTLALTNCTLRGNSGSAINNQFEGILTLTNCMLSDNSANNGGGIVNSGTATLTNCVLSGNSAAGGISDYYNGNGGAIFNVGTLALTNCTLTGNSASFGGGGIANPGMGGGLGGVFCNSLIVTNSTFSGNSADAGAGGIDGCVTSLANSIIANSNGANCGGSVTDSGHNLQFPGTSCGGTIPSRDPLLDPAGLQDNGGPTLTIALLPGSPAIDAGDTAACPATDQRGVPRPYAAACDIGAYERTACGNGILDPGEQCDDGNLDPGDGCTTTCMICGDGSVPCRICGDGSVTPPEQCDDGNLNEGDGCDSNCTPTGCGNGVVSAGEQCDTRGESTTCDADCTPAACGDGNRNRTAGEECDDGNRDDHDACRNNCRPNVCGDGILRSTPSPNLPVEECDDGNLANGDCCSSTCRLDRSGSPCFDGNVCDGSGRCDGGGACTPDTGAPLDCDDLHPETFDYCDALHGCQHGRPCAGDCGRNGQVTVDELLTMVTISLGATPAFRCPAGDTNQDGTITIDEIITAVDIALNGCGA